MSAIAAKDTNAQLLVRALVISLLLHVFVFGGWKYGQVHGWWRNSHLPNWLQAMHDKLIHQIAKTIPAPAQPQQPVTLTFVDVDPTLAVAEPPKKAKYMSSANSVASSTKKDDSELPELTGNQQKVLKTTDNNKDKPVPHPLQPTPKPKAVEAEKPSPAPKTYTPGDLAIAKPSPKANDSKSEQPEAQPHRRPRNVEEAKAMHGIRGDKMKHEGGSAHFGPSSLDAKSTITGSYDKMFIDAVQARWDGLLQDQQPTPVGEVRVEFKMHYDGRITDMKILRNTVDSFFSLLCQKAILDNAPYPHWPVEMRRELAGDTRDVTFTFFYE